MSAFEWEDKLDDGRDVMVHADEYESADDEVGLGEGCNVWATIDGKEVELTDKEYDRFQVIALDRYHESWQQDYDTLDDWPENDEIPY